MGSSSLRSIIYAQVCFYSGLLTAIVLKPDGLRLNAGISYYGIYAETIIPYLIAIVGSGWYCWQAAKTITSQSLRPLRLALKLSALLTIFIAATPYSVDTFADEAHVVVSSSLFVLQLILSGWLIMKSDYRPFSIALGAVELVAGIACALYLAPAYGFLLQFQIVFQAAFASLLVYFVKRTGSTDFEI